MATEQERITTELEDAERRFATARQVFEEVEVTLERAIAWARDLPHAYRTADRHERRRLNQAVFKSLWVFDDGVADYEFTDGLEILFEQRPAIVSMPPRNRRWGPGASRPAGGVDAIPALVLAGV